MLVNIIIINCLLIS